MYSSVRSCHLTGNVSYNFTVTVLFCAHNTIPYRTVPYAVRCRSATKLHRKCAVLYYTGILLTSCVVLHSTSTLPYNTEGHLYRTVPSRAVYLSRVDTMVDILVLHFPPCFFSLHPPHDCSPVRRLSWLPLSHSSPILSILIILFSSNFARRTFCSCRGGERFLPTLT